jgi:hypothetical protein
MLVFSQVKAVNINISNFPPEIEINQAQLWATGHQRDILRL